MCRAVDATGGTAGARAANVSERSPAASGTLQRPRAADRAAPGRPQLEVGLRGTQMATRTGDGELRTDGVMTTGTASAQDNAGRQAEAE